MLLGIPDMKTAIKEGWGPAQIIDANFGNAFSTVFLLVVAAAIFVCCLAIHDVDDPPLLRHGARRHAAGLDAYLSKVNPTLHTPVWSCIVIGLLAAIPFIQFAGVAIIAIAATGMIYLSYLIGNLALLRARLRGWPKTKAPFSLGRWGLPIDDPRASSGAAGCSSTSRGRARRRTRARTGGCRDAQLPLALAERPAGAVDGARS